MSACSIALVHHPVLDRQGRVITTAVTSIDLHDLGRSARTYGLERVFVVHPVAAQRELVDRIQAHWVAGSGARRIPTREAALAMLKSVPTLDDVYAELGGRDAVDVYVTAAREGDSEPMRYADARARIARRSKHALILFGTGWGLADSVLESADVRLAPIRSERSTYNHLSVRAACAIVLDRLFAAADDR